MLVVRQTSVFSRWLKRLDDPRTAEIISRRVARLEAGVFGDAKYFDGIGELRIDHGPGYRLYFVRRGREIVVLLCAGTKGSQDRDIVRAKGLAKEV
ncbi:MAG: type II toxin-antitoxin system RelE/ParE family toxin [Beijerinckiaceae bacterium]|nr:type II toxin-antitoxin system RelE/ParE family toxin [Beijerinckiaceae bacterium]